MLISKTRKLLKNLELAGKCFMEKRWAKLIAATVQGLGRKDASDMASSIAYYALLSMFPLLLGIIALLGLFLPSATVQRELFTFFEHYLPASVDIITENISRIIELRGTLGILSLLGLFWSCSAIFGAIGRAVNRAWGISQSRPFYFRKLRDLSIALGTSTLFFLSLGLTTVLLLLPAVELPLGSGLTVIISHSLAILLMLSTFLLLYKYMPNTQLAWRNVWPGALLATSLFEINRAVFNLYLTRFANYELVYGSIASIIVLLVWVYFSAFILILGAEFSSEYAEMKHNSSAAK